MAGSATAESTATVPLSAPFRISNALNITTVVISSFGSVYLASQNDVRFDVHAREWDSAIDGEERVAYKPLASADLTPVNSRVQTWFGLSNFNATSGLCVIWNNVNTIGTAAQDNIFSLILATDGSNYVWIYNYNTINVATPVTRAGFSNGYASYNQIDSIFVLPADATTRSNVGSTNGGIFAYYYTAAKTSGKTSILLNVFIN